MNILSLSNAFSELLNQRMEFHITHHSSTIPEQLEKILTLFNLEIIHNWVENQRNPIP